MPFIPCWGMDGVCKSVDELGLRPGWATVVGNAGTVYLQADQGGSLSQLLVVILVIPS